jgi:tetratricopeptide (TPR) repeat protein
MTLVIRHRLVVGISALLLLTQVGCAARSVAVAAPPDGGRAAPTPAEPVDCASFARAEAAALHQPSAAAQGLKTFGTGVLMGILGVASGGTCLTCAFIAPIAILGAPFQAVSIARDNSRARESAHASALELCRKPNTLEAELGPDHPDVARSLQVLAVRYVALGRADQGEALHRRALDIRERALPDGHPEIAESLEAVAVLLRRANQIEEAEAKERRAKTIRDDEEGQARATGRLLDFARTLGQRGSTEAILGNLRTAEAHYRRALAIQESEPGVDPEDLRRTLLGYAELLREVQLAAEADEVEARAAMLAPVGTSGRAVTAIDAEWIEASLE